MFLKVKPDTRIEDQILARSGRSPLKVRELGDAGTVYSRINAPESITCYLLSRYYYGRKEKNLWGELPWKLLPLIALLPARLHHSTKRVSKKTSS
jgi:hypothetical protein